MQRARLDESLKLCHLLQAKQCLIWPMRVKHCVFECALVVSSVLVVVVFYPSLSLLLSSFVLCSR